MDRGMNLAGARVLSLWQPWASLVAIGAKTLETRAWSTRWRGTLVIHSARTKMHLALAHAEPFRSLFAQAQVSPDALPLGAALAVCELETCLPTEAIEEWTRDQTLRRRAELALGDFSENRFAWDLRNVRPILQPLPMRGAQGLKTLAHEYAQAIALGFEEPITEKRR